MGKAVIEYTTGQPGSGKSYRRCGHYLVHEFFDPKKPTAQRFISNYPIEFEPWTDAKGVDQPGLIEVVRRKHGIERDEVLERVHVIPKEECDKWYRGDRKAECVGPWHYFIENEVNLDGAHIAIDEIHNFCPKSDQKALTAWRGWLGEIRHEGCTIEFLTQSPGKVGRPIEEHAGLRRHLVTHHGRTDPYFKIPLDDWYQVLTAFGKSYRPSVWQVEEREVKGKWQAIGGEMPFWFDPEIFGVYNSFSASHATGLTGGGIQEPYEMLSRSALIWWFLKRDGFRFFFNPMVPRALFIFAIFWGGRNFSTVMKWVSPSKAQPVVTAIADSEQGDKNRVQTNAYLPGEVENGLSEKERKQAIEAIENALRKIEAYERADEIVGMASGQVIYANGQRGRAGDEINFLLGTKKTIDCIDFANRVVYYVDGSRGWFRPGFGLPSGLTSADGTATEFRESLQRIEDDSARSPDRKSEPKPDNAFGGGLDNGRLR